MYIFDEKSRQYTVWRFDDGARGIAVAVISSINPVYWLYFGVLLYYYTSDHPRNPLPLRNHHTPPPEL